MVTREDVDRFAYLDENFREVIKEWENLKTRIARLANENKEDGVIEVKGNRYSVIFSAPRSETKLRSEMVEALFSETDVDLSCFTPVLSRIKEVVSGVNLRRYTHVVKGSRVCRGVRGE
jgi:sRNA-binding carbon storage regulator CsrA